MTKIAIMDDWQKVAMRSANWSKLAQRAELVVFDRPFAGPDAVVEALDSFDILLPMRERTPLPAAVIHRLSALKMVALTGPRSPSLDIAACTARHVPVCNTAGQHSVVATSELALALLLAAARRVPSGDAAIRAGRFQEGVPLGHALDGRTLGVIGLGRIGGRVARFGKALGMRVIAWSQNMTAETAAEAGAMLVDKATLLTESDAISLHLVLSDRSRGIIGPMDLERMKPGAILINTSRAGLVDQAALLAAVREGRVIAASDVFDTEPLPDNDPWRSAPNTVLTPHVGYGTDDVFAQFYGESVENIAAFLDGAPIRVINPDALVAA